MIRGVTSYTYFSLRYRATSNGADSALDVTDLDTGSGKNRVIFDFMYTTS